MPKCSGYFDLWRTQAVARASIGAALLLLLAGTIAGRAQGRSERDVKCLLFVTLARYTEWPANAFTSETSPVIMGVLGDDPFGGLLDSMTKNEKVRDRAIRVRKFASSEEIDQCHVLFFGGMSVLQRELELSRLRRRPILTVSDTPGFAREGGMVEMYVNEENKVRLRISEGGLARGRLSISQPIMRASDVVAMLEWLPEAGGWISEAGRTKNLDPLLVGSSAAAGSAEMARALFRLRSSRPSTERSCIPCALAPE